MENLLNKFKNGFRVKSALSNLYIYLERIQSSEETSIYQLGTDAEPKNSIWKIKEAGNNYLYIFVSNGNGGEYYLTCTENNNIEPRKFTGEENQKFFIHIKDKNYYKIRTKISRNRHALELKNNTIGINDRIKQVIVNDSPEQNWVFEPIGIKSETIKLKSANANSKTNEKKEKVVKTVIYKDDELVHTVVYVK